MKKTIGSGKFLRLVRDGKWEYVERTNASGVVAIVAITADERIILTEQFRPAVGCQVIDLPAGLAGDTKGSEDEAFAESAFRELIEETGFTARKLKHVADSPTSPGLTSEIISYFVTQDVEQKAAGGGIEGENILVHQPKISLIKRWLAKQVAQGKLVDGKVYAGLYFASQSVEPK